MLSPVKAEIKKSPEIKSIWVITLFKFFGIYYQVHISLPLVLIWHGYITFKESSDLNITLTLTLLIISLLLLYEVMRLFVAKFHGFEIDQITLYPFAGVSNINRECVKKMTTDKIDLFDPVTNKEIYKIARSESIPGVIFLLLAIVSFFIDPNQNNKLILTSFYSCLIISISALLPITPFPGGLLYFISSSKKGLLPNTTLIKLLFLFVLFSISSSIESVTITIVTITYIAIALEQHVFEKTRIATKSLKAKDVYSDLGKLICFQHGVLNNTVINTAYQSFQPFFPVMLESNLIGIINRKTLLKSASRAGEVMLSELSEKEFTVIDRLAPLSEALELFQIKDTDFILVADEQSPEKICGIISKEKMFEYLMLKSEGITDNQTDSADSF